MINTSSRLGFACCAAALVASAAAAQFSPRGYVGVPCECGVHAPHPPRVRYVRPSYEGYFSQSQPSAVMGHSSAVARPQPLPSQYYTSDEAQVLYHPVVVPLDEFLRSDPPVALTPDELARQRAAAEARTTPPTPPQGTTPAATTPEADPFADDTGTPGEPVGAETSTAPAEAAAEAPAEPADEDVFAEEAMPAEEPAAESTPEAEAPLESEPADADDDPFSDP